MLHMRGIALRTVHGPVRSHSFCAAAPAKRAAATRAARRVARAGAASPRTCRCRQRWPRRSAVSHLRSTPPAPPNHQPFEPVAERTIGVFQQRHVLPQQRLQLPRLRAAVPRTRRPSETKRPSDLRRCVLPAPKCSAKWKLRAHDQSRDGRYYIEVVGRRTPAMRARLARQLEYASRSSRSSRTTPSSRSRKRHWPPRRRRLTAASMALIRVTFQRTGRLDMGTMEVLGAAPPSDFEELGLWAAASNERDCLLCGPCATFVSTCCAGPIVCGPHAPGLTRRVDGVPRLPRRARRGARDDAGPGRAHLASMHWTTASSAPSPTVALEPPASRVARGARWRWCSSRSTRCGHFRHGRPARHTWKKP